MVEISPNAAPIRAVQSSVQVERTVPVVPALSQEAGRVNSAVTEAQSVEKQETVQKSAPAATVSDGSNIVTFRDGDTGRLVIKLVGRQNNEVLAEFPSPNQLSRYPSIADVVTGSSLLDKKA